MTTNPYQPPHESGTPAEPARWWAKQWLTPLAFSPFLVLLMIHWLLGISASMVEAPVFNSLIVIMGTAGVVLYLLHTFMLARRSWFWVIVKCAALLAIWSILMLLGS